jgi:transposase-like protein
MWVEKSREQLELLRNRFLGDPDWLAILIDGVWLTRELCVVVAVGIDIEGKKQVLDFEQGPSENTTVVSKLISRLAKRGVKANEQRLLLVLRDGSAAIAAAVYACGRRRCSKSAWCMPIPTFATSCADVTGRIWIFVSRRCARRREP